ncbi:unnamed protein product [Laminaria digitata]
MGSLIVSNQGDRNESHRVCVCCVAGFPKDSMAFVCVSNLQCLHHICLALFKCLDYTLSVVCFSCNSFSRRLAVGDGAICCFYVVGSRWMGESHRQKPRGSKRTPPVCVCCVLCWFSQGPHGVLCVWVINNAHIIYTWRFLTPSGPHSRFGGKLLGIRVRVSPKRECGPKGVKCLDYTLSVVCFSCSNSSRLLAVGDGAICCFYVVGSRWMGEYHRQKPRGSKRTPPLHVCAVLLVFPKAAWPFVCVGNLQCLHHIYPVCGMFFVEHLFKTSRCG